MSFTRQEQDWTTIPFSSHSPTELMFPKKAEIHFSHQQISDSLGSSLIILPITTGKTRYMSTTMMALKDKNNKIENCISTTLMMLFHWQPTASDNV